MDTKPNNRESENSMVVAVEETKLEPGLQPTEELLLNPTADNT